MPLTNVSELCSPEPANPSLSTGPRNVMSPLRLLLSRRTDSVSSTARSNEMPPLAVVMFAPSSVDPAPFCVKEPASEKFAPGAINSRPEFVISTEPVAKPAVVVTSSAKLTVPVVAPLERVVTTWRSPSMVTVLWNSTDSESATVSVSRRSPTMAPTAPAKITSSPASMVNADPVALLPSSSSVPANVRSPPVVSVRSCVSRTAVWNSISVPAVWSAPRNVLLFELTVIEPSAV